MLLDRYYRSFQGLDIDAWSLSMLELVVRLVHRTRMSYCCSLFAI